MRIAVIGAGFSGLAAAWHLLQLKACEITLFDQKGIGGGASGIATGLLHPYPGEQGRRSLHASEGLEATKELIAVAQQESSQKIILQEGLLRYVQNEEQREMFLSHCRTFGDVRPHSNNSLWIESGMTIDCPRYLDGLWQALAKKGTRLVVHKVRGLQELQEFDRIVLTAGAGMKHFPETDHLGLSTLKGQVLKCHIPDRAQLPEASCICKGYVALTEEPRVCFVGSTYERGDQTPDINPRLVKEELFPKIAFFYPDVDLLQVIGCTAAFRVTRTGHYLPIATRIKDNIWALTALGSRGLLYHAYFGKQLAANVLNPL